MIPILALAALTAVFHPAHPTVGDPITIDFRQPVVLDPAPQYEIGSNGGSPVAVRAFAPKPVTRSGHLTDRASRPPLPPPHPAPQAQHAPPPPPLAAPQPLP